MAKMSAVKYRISNEETESRNGVRNQISMTEKFYIKIPWHWNEQTFPLQFLRLQRFITRINLYENNINLMFILIFCIQCAFPYYCRFKTTYTIFRDQWELFKNENKCSACYQTCRVKRNLFFLCTCTITILIWWWRKVLKVTRL